MIKMTKPYKYKTLKIFFKDNNIKPVSYNDTDECSLTTDGIFMVECNNIVDVYHWSDIQNITGVINNG